MIVNSLCGKMKTMCIICGNAIEITIYNYCGKNCTKIIKPEKINIFSCGKACGKLLWKILIIYFIYVIVKANRKAGIIVKFKIFIYRNTVKKGEKK